MSDESILRPKIIRNAAKVRSIGSALHLSDSEVIERILDALTDYHVEQIFTFTTPSGVPSVPRRLEIRRVDKPRL